MTHNELSTKIRSGAYDVGPESPKDTADGYRAKCLAMENRFRQDLFAMLRDEYGLPENKAVLVYNRAISCQESDGGDMSILAAACDLVRFAMAVTGLSDKDAVPEPSHACPVCGADVSEDADVDLEDSDEDGYGGMTAPAVCPKCGARLVAHYVSGGYAFDHFEKS